VAGGPLADIGKLERVRFVMQNGQLIRNDLDNAVVGRSNERFRAKECGQLRLGSGARRGNKSISCAAN